MWNVYVALSYLLDVIHFCVCAKCAAIFVLAIVLFLFWFFNRVRLLSLVSDEAPLEMTDFFCVSAVAFYSFPSNADISYGGAMLQSSKC